MCQDYLDINILVNTRFFITLFTDYEQLANLDLDFQILMCKFIFITFFTNYMQLANLDLHSNLTCKYSSSLRAACRSTFQILTWT